MNFCGKHSPQMLTSVLPSKNLVGSGSIRGPDGNMRMFLRHVTSRRYVRAGGPVRRVQYVLPQLAIVLAPLETSSAQLRPAVTLGFG